MAAINRSQCHYVRNVRRHINQDQHFEALKKLDPSTGIRHNTCCEVCGLLTFDADAAPSTRLITVGEYPGRETSACALFKCERAAYETETEKLPL